MYQGNDDTDTQFIYEYTLACMFKCCEIFPKMLFTIFILLKLKGNFADLQPALYYHNVGNASEQ